jgi:octaprenyl-diphosphate synthase
VSSMSETEAALELWVGRAVGERDLGPFLELLPVLSRDLSEIEERLRTSLPISYPFLYESASYATESGGKRVRPLLMSAGFRALGYRTTRAIQPLAAAIQLIHTASLVHDDVIDHAQMRRGKPAVTRAFGVPAAIVTGDYLFVRAFQLAAEYSAEIIRRCGEACAELAQGEIMQENSRFDLTVGRERYLRIMTYKTASIVAAGMASVAMVAEAPLPVVQGLEEYGRCVGVAFQIQDDLLDVYGDPDMLGKVRFTDFREGLPTLVALDTHTVLVGRERAEFERLFSRRHKKPADLIRLKELADAAGARDRGLEEARRWGERAVAAVRILPAGPYRDLLERMALGAVTRRY